MAPILYTEQVPLRGYVTFNSSGENPLEEEGLCCRDVTSPINERDIESSSSSSSRGTCAHPVQPAAQAGPGAPVCPSYLPPGLALGHSHPAEHKKGPDVDGPGSCEERETLLVQQPRAAWGSHSTPTGQPTHSTLVNPAGGRPVFPPSEGHAFCANLGPVRSSSSEGLARAQGLSSEASVESNEDSDHACKSSVRRQAKSYMKTKNPDSQWPPCPGTDREAFPPESRPQTPRTPYSGPQDVVEAETGFALSMWSVTVTVAAILILPVVNSEQLRQVRVSDTETLAQERSILRVQSIVHSSSSIAPSQNRAWDEAASVWSRTHSAPGDDHSVRMRLLRHPALPEEGTAWLLHQHTRHHLGVELGDVDLAALLEQIGCLKYLQVFEEQDVDLRIFLTLTESDLKEIGITLFGPKRKMTSAIARWHSSARPPGDALELAYADRLEAEMQELAIQLHKRCEEVEAIRGQVCQEQELRAVVESCLLEQDRAREDIQAQLRETWVLARDAALILDQLRPLPSPALVRVSGRACQAELSARVRRDQPPGAATLGPALPPAESKGWQVSLQAMSLPELSGALEDHVREMGQALCSVTQSLEKLQVLNGKKWREP
ncbi:hypothetical protein P7K49_022920 [Saguinus oedipus]|uniref:SAM domain-containing protein n=1 Tax=Saguinus oedipus TaxID=9490 RepID=A0ABQ9UK70_SAGOE|nr:hypothetical protein P7K49_022920 [Saguinus oedipus]